jgi:hypothetical protein
MQYKEVHMRTWGLSPQQQVGVWDGWGRGQTVRAIARTVGKHETKVWADLRQHGGQRPVLRRRHWRWDARKLDDVAVPAQGALPHWADETQGSAGGCTAPAGQPPDRHGP